MRPVVLCIDSREGNLRAEKYLLQRAGYDVLTAETIDCSAELLRQNAVDIVLLSDEITFDDQASCAQLRRLAPSARIVLQRASFDKPYAPPDADMVLPKTINPREKLLILARLLLRQAA